MRTFAPYLLTMVKENLLKRNYMRKRKLFLVLSFLVTSLSMVAQSNYSNMPPLHVDGNQLKDPAGNKVVLHGVMDTPSMYFNNDRWSGGYTDKGATNCVNYFAKLFRGITANNKGAYCNLFRLHLDCCWTNDNSVTWPQDEREAGTGEANISHYNPARLTEFMDKVYTKIANLALKMGLYVIMRPPGVCPGDIYVGGSYQNYLLDVWDRVTKNEFVLNNYGVVSIELANEPVRVYDANGVQSDHALRDFFQPIVDKIRANGFKGIIWLPGTGWQSGYQGYAKCPVVGDEIGFAVHDYTGWYGTSDNSYNHETAIKNFGNQVPVVRTNPIVITEVDWSPEKEGTGHYNEHGDWVVSNYGTWSTGTTSKWGGAYKATLDFYDNISMTLSGTACYIDIDDLIYNNKVTPAFKTAMEANGLDPYEACGVACFDWYAQYAQVDYPSFERYQPLQVIPENPFERSSEWFNPTILYEGSVKHASNMSTLSLKKGGCSGWRFEEEEGLDLSDYNYLVIDLGRAAATNIYFVVYDTSNYWAEHYKLNIGNSGKTIKFNLHEMKDANGNPIDPSHIRIAGFTSVDGDQTLYVKSVFPSMDGINPATAIESVETGEKEICTATHYSLDGRLIDSTEKGVHVVKYSNGSVKKVFVQ